MKTISIAKALVLDPSGHMLLLRRSSTHPTLALQPDLPGGLIDEGEEPGEALAREIKEETGLTVEKTQLALTYAGADVYEDENRVRLLYIVRLDETQPAIEISWEHDKAEWVSIGQMAQIETEFHSFYHDGLHYLRQHKLLEG